MSSVTIYEFAQLADAVYAPQNPSSVPNGWTQEYTGMIGSGFWGARYYKRVAGKTVRVAAFRGTQTNSVNSWVTDAGFAPSMSEALAFGFGPMVLVALVSAGRSKLAEQLLYANEMANQANVWSRKDKGDLFVVGHSLGGGLAQIVSSFTGLPAVTFSAPAVSQLRDVTTKFSQNSPKIVNIAVAGDPVNATEHIGKRLGQVVRLHDGRSGTEAHLMSKTVMSLSPLGGKTRFGQMTLSDKLPADA